MTGSRRQTETMPTDAAHLAAAQANLPTLLRRERLPLRRSRVTADATAFQGWRVDDAGAIDLPAPLARDQTLILDLGEHLVGRVELRLGFDGRAPDAPVRLAILVAEMPAELADPIEPFTGTLSRAWFQDEVVVVEDLPAVWRAQRRFAGRWIAIRATSHTPAFTPRLEAVVFHQEGAEVDDLSPDPGLPEDLAAIDLVARRTLRNCLQTVLEDGPKRDRRLWLGDLRLQALADAVTFRRVDVVRRCLHLLAAFSRDDGLIGVCCYERPEPRADLLHAIDYNLLLMPTLVDYAEAADDPGTVRRLWPVAMRQLTIVLDALGDRDRFDLAALPGCWAFIDWNERCAKQAPVHAILVYALRAGAELGRKVGESASADRFTRAADRFTAAARRHWLRDDGLVVGDEGQVSWATQAWMILAGILDPAEGCRALTALAGTPDAVRPVAPYCWHHVVHASLVCGMDAEALALIRSYWGAMVARGADTFWEVYDPADDHRSPYGTHLLNSACHAWSCTPAWFLRTFRERLLAVA